MSAGDAMRASMIDLDTAAARLCWAEIAPWMPQPQNDGEALVTLHHARTQADSIPDKLRFYSHCWLIDRGFPSGLPDHLRPKAQQMHPRKVDAVGVSVKSMSISNAPLAKAIEKAMSDAVAECYAFGTTEASFVRSRMEEARLQIMGKS